LITDRTRMVDLEWESAPPGAAGRDFSRFSFTRRARWPIGPMRTGATTPESTDRNMKEELISRDEDITRAALSIKAMAHPLRLKILCILGDESVNVQDIVDICGTTQSNISQHLAIMRSKGILGCR